MSTAAQLALKAGIPVRQHRDGSTYIRATQATYDYLTGDHPEVLVWLLCHCRSFRYPHSLEAHKQLRFGDSDWRTFEERCNQWVEEERYA